MSQTYTDDCYAPGMQATVSLQAFENNFAALKSAFSGATTPSNLVAGMWWYDTTANILKLRNEANDAWQSVWDFANNKPVLANVVSADFAAAMKDAAAATASLRTLGSGAAQACAGNDSRLGTIADGSITAAKLLAITSAGTEIYLAKAVTERTKNSTSYEVTKQTLALTRGGSVTVSFELKTTLPPATAYGRVYVNSSAVGTERSDTTGSYQTFSQNFSVNVGDVVQVYAKGSAKVQNLYVTANDPYTVREATGL